MLNLEHLKLDLSKLILELSSNRLIDKFNIDE